MATITRAKNYFVYLLAIFISAVFAWAGRPSPSWASEIKTIHTAKVFDDEIYRVAQADTNISTTDSNIFFGTIRPMTQVRLNYRINDNMPAALHPYLGNINQQLDGNLDVIRTKLAQNQGLDAAELSLLYSAQNSTQINNIVNQYNVLINMIQSLIDNQNRQ